MTPADVLPFSNPYNKQKVSAFEYANDYNDLYSVWVTGAQSVRPVINLNGNLNYTKGNGMRTTPYVVE